MRRWWGPRRAALCGVAVALCGVAGAAAAAPYEACDRSLLVQVHRMLEPVVTSIAEIHTNFTSMRHTEVVEIISVFHIDMLARNALRYVESLRLTLCVLICPSRHHFFSGQDIRQLDSEVFVRQLALATHLNDFFDSVRYLATSGGANVAEGAIAWHSAGEELISVSRRLEEVVRLVHSSDDQRLWADGFSRFEPLLLKVLTMVVDFLGSIAEDTGTLFAAPNFVAPEMMPIKEAGWAGTSVDIFVRTPRGTRYHLDFMRMLDDSGTILSQPAFPPALRECAHLPPLPGARSGGLPGEFADMLAMSHTDVSGVRARHGVASPLQLLHAAGRHARLSNLFISAQIAPYLLSTAPSCGGRLVLYDPSQCLLDNKWGGYFFHMNPLPPLNMSVVYSGKPLGRGTHMQPEDIHSIEAPSMDMQWSSLVSTFKSMNHHSPDLLFVSPFVGNCHIIDRMLGSGSVHPKLIYMPINPLVPPPEEVTPDFFAWWSEHGEVLWAQLLTGVVPSDGPGGAPVSSSVWQAQCSLAAGARVLRRHGYLLAHVEHTYAAFLWRPIFLRIFGEPRKLGGLDEDGSGLEPLHTSWMRGWQCSPHSRYLYDLEVFAGGPAGGALAAPASEGRGPATPAAAEEPGRGERGLSRAELRELSASVIREVPTLRFFLEEGRGPEDLGRGRCAEGVCECLPPFRGATCEEEDPPRVEQRIRGVIHYVTAETEQDMVDLSWSLSTLWARFNRRFDYPVVVFHEGLSLAARRRIVEASENRVWFALLPRFTEVPRQWARAAGELAEDFSVGYRAMIRWRSGPMFLEPALAGFDYAMTLDTDSYIPADLAEDPFELLRREGWVAAFPHLGRESASVVVNFMHHFLLYARLQGLHPRRTEMLQALIEKNFKWYQQCLMLDMEVVRLDWFRGQAYQKFFRYMDSTGGFWLHRWGNNPVRTFAVGLLLEDSQVRSLTLPYAHQDYCSCGPGAPPCRADPSGRYSCDAGGRGIAASDLAEGLLDLQPWRGTARQKEKYRPEHIEAFVKEQMPL